MSYRFIARTFSLAILSCTALLGGRAAADPVKLAVHGVTASATSKDSSPNNACDGDTSTMWASGTWASQWIQLDLGEPLAITKLRLLPSQLPTPANTEHQIAVSPDGVKWTTVFDLKGSTSDSQWIDTSNYTYAQPPASSLGGVRYVRVTTVSSPSWVSWFEIEVYGSLEYTGYYETPATTKAANLVRLNSSNLTQLASGLASAQANNQKALIDVSQLWLSSGDPTLKVNWQSLWAQINSTIKAGGYANQVAGFAPHDYPYGQLALNGAFNINAMQTALWSVVNQIHVDFPLIPMASIISVEELKRGQAAFNKLLTPADYAMFTWLGFDCRDNWDSACGYGMPTLFTMQDALSSPNQRRIAMAQSSLPVNSWPNDMSANGLSLVVGAMNRWDHLLRTDPRYVLVMPYAWADNTPVAGDKGASSQLWLQNRVYQLVQPFFPALQSVRQLFPESVTASSSYAADPRNLPYAAVGEDPAAYWNAGGFAPAWIEFTFDGLTHFGEIDLTVSQSPAGNTVHVLEGLNAAGTWVPLQTFTNYTFDGMTMMWLGSAEVTAIRIRTTSTPSWVGWKSVKFWGAAHVLHL